jgi:hypothetical protein
MFSSDFDPVANLKVKVLILGTLPGQVSLEKQQYYAQPRNQLWKGHGTVAGFHPTSPAAVLGANPAPQGSRCGLWDVCAAAHRPGSLDSSIATRSVLVVIVRGRPFLTGAAVRHPRDGEASRRQPARSDHRNRASRCAG